MTEASASPVRRPYHGSCHCGHTKYIIFLTLPPTPVNLTDSPPSSQRITRFYRCNCSTCHKAAIFHTRPANPHTDFYLLSPLDPGKDLGDYTCFEKDIHFYFCPKCGVRCFSFYGKGKVIQIDPRVLQGREEAAEAEKPGVCRVVWRVVDDPDARDGKGPYLSINAHTIEVDQGLDMRKLTDDKLVMYVDCRGQDDEHGLQNYEYPHAGGSW